MHKARNGLRRSAEIKKQAAQLRENGRTHREIAKALNISLGSAWLWAKNIQLTAAQKSAVELRRPRHHFNPKEKAIILKRLKPHQFRNKYSDEDLIQKIQKFYDKNGRIPLKREFNALRIFRTRFGSWNNAIKKAGFDANPLLFAKRFKAEDGHICDSFTEKIIDDWLFSIGKEHKRHVRYGHTKLTADFALGANVILEFFGLAGVKSDYDSMIARKKELAKSLGLKLVEVYPEDIFPRNKLIRLLKEHI